MRIVFTRTGERRYRVTAERSASPRVAMEPAPGYHEHIPHDLVHFVVERSFGLRDGIYGQLAAGGDSGTFWPVDEPRTRRFAKRSAARNAGAEVERSERLAATVMVAWARRHGATPEVGLGHVPDELATPTEVDRVVDELDGIAASWHPLPVGGSISLDWPWPERRARRPG